MQRNGAKPHEELARMLRTAILEGSLKEGDRLPTEAELVATYGLSRQNVRSCMHDLVTEGLVYRVAGRGTFVTSREDRNVNEYGSVEDLMGSSLDTDYELLEPLRRHVDLPNAGRLHLKTDAVMSAHFRRLHGGVAFCYTSVHLPPDIGGLLDDVDALRQAGATSRETVAELLDSRLPTRIASAEQSITVGDLESVEAQALNVPPGTKSLRIDILYFDETDRIVELQISHFLPEHYAYRSRLRRRTVAAGVLHPSP
jgi:GntR family transcriptional regulator